VSIVYAGSGASGYLLGGWAEASSLLWLSDEGGRLVPASAAALQAVEGIDPELGLARADLADPAPAVEELDAEAVQEAIARARLMQAFGLVAAGRKMLELALAHAADRTQFGRSLASFQAVKHQLADCAVELESAHAVAEYAVESGDEIASLTARALAGRAAFVTSRASQQVMGAMGFTWEVPLHLYVRRLHVDDLILGPWEALAVRLGRQLIADQRVPRLGEA
jgi:alkylation response protein AidB-like acyl-CoA dehydrogenase